MKRLILAAMALVFALAAQAQEESGENRVFHYEDAVQVNGRAEKKVTPDEIYVEIALKDNEPKGQTVDRLETRMKREFAVLGIDLDKALRVTSLANAPRKRGDIDTRRSYELKVSDTRTLNSVFEALGEMGVSDARVTKVAHSLMDEFRREVRIEAIKNAKEIAATLAGAIDQSIGEAVWIIDNGYYENSPMPIYTRAAYAKMEMADASYGAGAAESGLDMQDITLTYNISAKFVLKRK